MTGSLHCVSVVAASDVFGGTRERVRRPTVSGARVALYGEVRRVERGEGGGHVVSPLCVLTNTVSASHCESVRLASIRLFRW